ATSDVILILLGIGGIGRVSRSFPGVLEVLKWVGVAYLVGYSLYSFWRASRREVLLPSVATRSSRRVIASTTLAFTFLNPHVYLDTVLLLGSIRWLFAAGACTGSIAWFVGLGYGAKAMAPLMSRPRTWRVLDLVIGVVMLGVAFSVATTHVAS